MSCMQVHSHVKQQTFSSSWYFMILWTGLMSRSLSCSLWPNCCLRSCQVTKKGESVLSKKSLRSSSKIDWSIKVYSPQSRSQCTQRQHALILVCSDSKPHTCEDAVPGNLRERVHVTIILNNLWVRGSVKFPLFCCVPVPLKSFLGSFVKSAQDLCLIK